MSAKSVMEEVLLLMLWSADRMSRPTLRNVGEKFETWERRQGLHLRLHRLEQRKLIEREEKAGAMVYQLTASGRLASLGGRDVQARWNRTWDGKFRQLLFDLPANHRKIRIRLWRWLRENGFGYLQQSVWIHPDPVAEVLEILREFHGDVESMILMDANCCAGYANEAVVMGSWDFDEINRRYANYQRNACLTPKRARKLAESAEALGHWLRQERVAWRHALALDPLLPQVLWPAGYEGPTAWNHRMETRQLLASCLPS